MQDRALYKIRPKYEDYMNQDGSIIVKFEKTLYGLIESSLKYGTEN